MRRAHPERALQTAVERSGAVCRGERIVVACSGGPDSIALAALLASCRKKLGLQLLLAHANHGVRPSAWQDEAVALHVSAALGIPVKIAALSVRSRSEAALREARYTALLAIARGWGANAIATAHHAQDQTETVLLALFRGTGAQGLAGMPARRALADDVDLVRPLLQFEKERLVEYVQRAGLPYVLDPSNDDLELRRNAVRRALGALRPSFPGLDEAVARAARMIAEELDGHPHAALRREVRGALRRHQALEGVDFEHVAAAVRALERGRSGRFAMASGVWLTIENGRLTVDREMK